jgi:hypothetical protein
MLVPFLPVLTQNLVMDITPVLQQYCTREAEVNL